jgi:acetyl esterase/lipase
VDLVRLLVAALALGFGLLAVFPAPTYRLWEAAVVATEWGGWIALAAILLVLPLASRTRAGLLAAGTATVGAVLLLSPLMRAAIVASALPGQMREAFGPASPRARADAPARPAPLVALDLARGVASPRVRVRTLTYATRADGPLRMDVYLPAGGAPAPGVVVVHGGSWRGGDRTELAPLNRYLAARGYLVASVDYRLAPAHRAADVQADVAAALAFLKANAAALGMDPARMVLLGRSAGGQVALLAAFTANDSAIRGVVSFYGPADLLWGYAHPPNPSVLDGRLMLRQYLGGAPAGVRDAYLAASPIRFVGPRTPPVLLIHGGRDELVSAHHADLLSRRLALFARPHLFVRLPWATHGCDYVFGGPCGQVSTWAVERFLAAVTR